MRQTISVAVVFLSYLPGIFTGEGNVYASFREKVQVFLQYIPFRYRRLLSRRIEILKLLAIEASLSTSHLNQPLLPRSVTERVERHISNKIV